LVHTTCFGTGESQCVLFDFGEERTDSCGDSYYAIECRYLDFDGKAFGEVSIMLGIPRFSGTRRIDTLNAFPLQYHQDESLVRTKLVAYGRKFVSLIGVHHRHYQGEAFYVREQEVIKKSINSRIMIDAAFFWKMNPNYSRCTSKKTRNIVRAWRNGTLDKLSDNQVMSGSIELATMKEEDLLICCPTMLGFSFSDKLWGKTFFLILFCIYLIYYYIAEFSIADIEDIEWSTLPFQSLSIPTEQRDVIMALVEPHITDGPRVAFDDFVNGKGKGLNLLLQYGSESLLCFHS
jgi:hypothetical protein